MEGDAGHLGGGPSLGPCIPSTHSSLCLENSAGVATPGPKINTPLYDALYESDRKEMSTVLTFGLVLRTDATNCLASAVAEIHSSERRLVHLARSHRVSSRCCLHALSMALTDRHAPDLKF
jgi:hypothetical protein